MSILPIQSQQGSSNSFDSVSSNPNLSNHGSSLSSPQSPSSLSRHFQSSMQFSDPQSPVPPSGLLSPASDDSAGSSRKVNDLRRPNVKRTYPQRNVDNSQSYHGSRGGQHAQSKGKMLGTSPPGQQSNGQRGGTHSSGRKAQMTNANHLLNFHYDHPSPRSHQPRMAPPRRQQKIKPYNRDLFLHSNYKFVLLDTGNYSPESMDPDKMLNWDDIVCVRYATPFPVQCPICLEYPLCPQITSCGHIFCFPCILQYLLMGKEDHKGDCFKRCPLCFVMISQKDLYTIYIEEVKQYNVGDTLEFMLLTRRKDSFTPSQKTKPEDTLMSCNKGKYDPFSKFTFTSDVELSVRNAIYDLDSWLAKADSGLVDDMEKLPYVCAAMEKLEERKKYWNAQQISDNIGNYKNVNSHNQSSELFPTGNMTCVDDENGLFPCSIQSIENNDETKWSENVNPKAVVSVEDEGTTVSSPYTENKSVLKISHESRNLKDNDSYNFYQAVDGQHLILHPLNMKCLLHHYGSYDLLPNRIGGKILQLEMVTQTEAMRRRYRYLSHFSLTTTFHLCEIDIREVLPSDALVPFMDEIKKREKLRKELAKKERMEKIKAEVEAVAALPMSNLSSFGQSSHGDSPKFSMEDFEALGSSSAMSSSPPILSSPPVVGEKLLFSNVTRLGYAAGHDSPNLKMEETSAVQRNQATINTSNASGTRNSGTPTFATVTSRVQSGENPNASKTNDIGKKGKKQSRVLLSTAGGRRY